MLGRDAGPKEPEHGARAQCAGRHDPRRRAGAAARSAAAPAFTPRGHRRRPRPRAVRLAPDRRHVVFTTVGRYFGHPLFPDFGEDSNLFLDRRHHAASALQLTTGTAPKTYPVFSPDSRFVAYESEGDIWRVDVDHRRRATPDRARVARSQRRLVARRRSIAFVSSRWGRQDIYVMSADGEAESTRSRHQRRRRRGQSDLVGRRSHALLRLGPRRSFLLARASTPCRSPAAQSKRLTPADDAKNAGRRCRPMAGESPTSPIGAASSTSGR